MTGLDHPQQMLRQLLAQTRDQLRLIVRVLRRMAPGRGGNFRGVAAARLIERLFDEISDPSSTASNHMVNWVAGKSSSVVWHMVAVGVGAAPTSGAPLESSATASLEDGQLSVIAAIKDPLMEAGTTADAVIERSLDVIQEEYLRRRGTTNSPSVGLI
ncbi:hypothetical protein M427DRAFT_320072 [Gonapodya prolifera JEL478]|uniref:Uncharacterized protein n=1 Tax=Gonapodya prolifera (strain JEL478) TaxID=1344416 RepID=A0A139AFV3_GONPJ|nr:hypothetical protein M427DRAFT_320072 [Gonapodya prolifera JEL478]|eukprot:KXS15667.1 hypothetical protein M427DRAFT_320072 [Gonapodya prolifera JEL478]